MTATEVRTAATAEEARRAGEIPVRMWPLPVIAVLLVAGILAYVEVARNGGTGWIRPFDSIESRLVTYEAISRATFEHLWLTLVSTVAVTALCIPLGILLSRRGARWVGAPVLSIANAGQAIPSIGLLVLLAIVWDIGFWPAVVGLVAYAALPVIRNTMIGLQQVDPAILDAGRGMGMSPGQVLMRIELPLAVPIMMAGIRVALVLNVGVATLATFTNAGGLGDMIEGGISVNRIPVMLTGSVLVIALALLIDWVAGIAERRFGPRGL